MTEPVTMILRLPPDLACELEALSRRLKRSKTEIAQEAIASRLAWHARQLAQIERALTADQSGDPSTPHDRILDWVENWVGVPGLPATGAAIRNAIARIIAHPQIGEPGRVEGTRELLIPHTDHTIVYRVVGNRARILAIAEDTRSPAGGP